MKNRSRFRRRSLSASMAALAVTAVSSSQAEIIWSGVIDHEMVLGGQGITFALEILPVPEEQWPLLFVFDKSPTYINLQMGAVEGVGEGLLANALTANTPINADSGFTIPSYNSPPAFHSFRIYSNQQPSAWSNGDRSYLGFRDTDGQGAHYYGWVDLSISEDGSRAIIHSWAYESTPNKGILAGAIPEPGFTALGTTALAVAAARRLRRRKRRQS